MLKEYQYPFESIGNQVNPKLIILLENPGANPYHFKWNSEYAMEKDGVYSKSGMSLSVVKEYESWWFKLSEIWNKKFDDNDVLALEFYPYATDPETKRNEIYPKDRQNSWDTLALKSLEKNVKILEREIKKNTPIFVYYKAGWFDVVPYLNTYPFRSQLTKTSFRHEKLKKFTNFINGL